MNVTVIKPVPAPVPPTTTTININGLTPRVAFVLVALLGKGVNAVRGEDSTDALYVKLIGALESAGYGDIRAIEVKHGDFGIARNKKTGIIESIDLEALNEEITKILKRAGK